MGAMSEEIPRLLCQVHSRVCRRLQHETGLAAPVGQNAKGDTQQRFDVVADAVIRRALRESFGSGIILSEESDAVQFGEAPPSYRFVVDPVDGSDNWGRGLPLSAVSIAVLPVDGPIQPDRVSWAMVGELREHLPLTAGHVTGAYRGSHRIRVSEVRTVSSAFLSCELNHYDPPPIIGSVFHASRTRHHARPLRGHRQDRRRRHGRGVSGERHEAGLGRRAQGEPQRGVVIQ